jgi:transketolase N-terminal domain/subunit
MVTTVDGHDMDGLEQAFGQRDDRRPGVVIADIPEGEW